MEKEPQSLHDQYGFPISSEQSPSSIRDDPFEFFGARQAVASLHAIKKDLSLFFYARQETQSRINFIKKFCATPPQRPCATTPCCCAGDGARFRPSSPSSRYKTKTTPMFSHLGCCFVRDEGLEPTTFPV